MIISITKNPLIYKYKVTYLCLVFKLICNFLCGCELGIFFFFNLKSIINNLLFKQLLSLSFELFPLLYYKFRWV